MADQRNVYVILLDLAAGEIDIDLAFVMYEQTAPNTRLCK